MQAAYIAVLHRYPFALDAYELGFAPGIREDYTYQAAEYPNVELPVVVLDNEFRNPDVERYLEAFQEYDPSVAVLGDAYSSLEAQQFDELVDELQAVYPAKRYVVVPKCEAAFDILDDDVVLGYAAGYSDIHADEVSSIQDWRGQKVHVLGGAPPTQYEVIERLTQPTVTGEPPADIVGMDWNGFQKAAYVGEYWSRDGYQSADDLSIRETVRESLQEIKYYWKERGVWPETEPRELYGPAVTEPDEHIYMDHGGDPIPSREALEAAYIDEYDDRGVLAFEDETAKAFIEYREDLTSIDQR